MRNFLNKINMKAWMYILECADASYYIGSTKYLELRLAQHQAGEGANHTKKRLPVRWFILKSMHALMRLFDEKSSFRAGAGRRKRL